MEPQHLPPVEQGRDPQLATGVLPPVLPEDERVITEFQRDFADAEASEVIIDKAVEEATFVSPALRMVLDGKYLRTLRQPEVASDEAQLAAQYMEQRGYAKEAPRLSEQAKDQTRQTLFHTYDSRTRTEHQGLVNLENFLDQFIGTAQDYISLRTKGSTDELVEYAKSMKENLTFIGKPEFDEAVKGIGELWKSYLSADPNRQLAVLTEICSLDRYTRKGRLKSDEYLWNKIMETFTEEEKAYFGPRIVSDIQELTSDPANTRIVMLDDWTISGSQMRDVFSCISEMPEAQPYIQAGCVEINVMAASSARIKDGLELNPYDEEAGFIPVRAYFKAHNAPLAIDSGLAHITGLHCAVNYGFYGPCKDMRQAMAAVGLTAEAELARIRSDYHEQPPTSRGVSELLRGIWLKKTGREDRRG